MKTIINGNQVECSVEEYKQLTSGFASTVSPRKTYIKVAGKKWSPWSEADKQYLVENYTFKGSKKIAKVLKRTRASVIAYAQSMNLAKHKGYSTWSKENEQYLLDNQGNLTNKAMAQVLGKSLPSVYAKLNKLKNAKSQALTPGLN